jgi:hypothetical protein
VAAVRAKKKVAVQAYASIALHGATVIVASDGAELVARWPGHWLNVVADGERALLALLDPAMESVRQAISVASVPLAVLLHSGFSAEMRLRALLPELESLPSARDIAARAETVRRKIADPANLPGARELQGSAAARPRKSATQNPP